MTTQQKWIIATLLLAQFTHVLDFVIMMPLSTHFIEELHIDVSLFSTLVASYGFSAAFSGFFSTMFTDKYDRKHLFTLIFIGFIIGTLACALAKDYTYLLIARIVTGLFGGILSGQTFAILSDVFPIEIRARATGIVMAGFSIASALGVPMGLYLANHYGLSSPFYALVFVGGITLVLVIKYIPNLNTHIASKPTFINPFSNLVKVLSNPNQRNALLMSSFIILGGFPVITTLNPFLKNNMGFTEENIMLMYVIGGILTIFSANFIGYLSDRKGKHIMILILGFLSLIPLFLITHLNKSVTLTSVFILLAFFFLVVNGRNVPSIALSTSVAPPESRGSYMGVNSFLQQVSMGLAASISGLIIVQDKITHLLSHFDWVGYVAMGCSLLAIFFSRFVVSIEKTN